MDLPPFIFLNWEAWTVLIKVWFLDINPAGSYVGFADHPFSVFELAGTRWVKGKVNMNFQLLLKYWFQNSKTQQKDLM